MYETSLQTICDANLGGANLGGANLRGANLGGANLRVANLGGANLRDANLGGANLGGANLRDADLRGADLRGANLGDANLRGADLGDANLRGADLRDANLGGANLGGADLGDANLRGANLRGANLGSDHKAVGAPLQLGPIGSRDDTLFVWPTNRGIYARTGCFGGSVDELLAAVASTHGNDGPHGVNYREAIAFATAVLSRRVDQPLNAEWEVESADDPIDEPSR